MASTSRDTLVAASTRALGDVRVGVAGRPPGEMDTDLSDVRDLFGGDGEAWSAGNLIRHYQRVERGLIRVEADEVTYPLHIILRYRLERALLDGSLSVSELPAKLASPP